MKNVTFSEFKAFATNDHDIDFSAYKISGCWRLCFDGFKHGKNNSKFVDNVEYRTLSEALQYIDAITTANY